MTITITNKAQGDRILNVRKGEALSQVLVPAGASREIDGEIVQDDSFKTWKDAGEIEVGGAKAHAGAKAPDHDPSPSDDGRATRGMKVKG